MKGKNEMSLVLKNVSKTFVGKVAVDNISFSIEKPGVYGLLGTNGAGKTTTIRMLLGIIKKDSGEITWKGKEVDRENVNFGYLPEERGVYPKTKIMDQLMYFQIHLFLSSYPSCFLCTTCQPGRMNLQRPLCL